MLGPNKQTKKGNHCQKPLINNDLKTIEVCPTVSPSFFLLLNEFSSRQGEFFKKKIIFFNGIRVPPVVQATLNPHKFL